MKLVYNIVIVLITLPILVSCYEHSNISDVLDDVETYINDSPDSALNVLSAIDYSSLRGGADRNHYTLLLAQAKDKCYIDETDDSLMTIAVEYYQKKNNPHKLFKAYYYIGRIQENAGKYGEAMLSYLKAEQIIDEVDDLFQKGLLYAHIGKLYKINYDFQASLVALNKALEYYIVGEKIAHQYYTKYDIGHTYRCMKKYDVASAYMIETMEWAFENSQYSFCSTVFDSLCFMYLLTEDRDALTVLYDSKFAKVKSTSLYQELADVYIKTRTDISAFSEVFKNAWDNAVCIEDSTSILHQEYRFYKFIGDYDKSLSSHEQLLNLQDSLVRTALQKPMTEIQTKYFQAKAENLSLTQKNHLVLFVLVIVLLILFSALIIFRIKSILKRKSIEIENYIALADDLNSTLNNKTGEMAIMSAQVSDLFSRQYKLLDELCKVYYETHGSSKDKEAIYKKVKSEIEGLSRDKKCISDLEVIVNTHKQDIMILIRKEMPILTEMDFRLLCYLIAGFSAKTISVLTGDSTGNIYVKKSRFKKMLLEQNTKESTKILSYLA